MSKKFHLIFLAGGIGSRMNAHTPKQYLMLNGKSVAQYSFDVFLSIPEIGEIVVVCEPEYKKIFLEAAENRTIKFAIPGIRRQDSVYNGFQQISEEGLICIHDSARPFVEKKRIYETVEEAFKCGSAALGVRVKATIKCCDKDRMILNTPSRENLWEMQTPQVIRSDILKKGFEKAINDHLTVTDDVHLSELAGYPSRVVEGSYSNIKITTGEDMDLAEQILKKHVCI